MMLGTLPFHTTYCLEKHTGRKPLQPTWTRYAVCGNRTLLERVRMGQLHPEHWRVTLVNAGGSRYSEEAMMKAG